LLLIDLCLPDTAGGKPNIEGGIEFYNLLLKDSKAHIPNTTSFITAIEPLSDNSKERILDLGLSYCILSTASEQWKKAVLGLAKRSTQISERNLAIRVDFALVTALGTPELDAVLKLPYGWVSRRFPDDPTTYHFGAITCNGRSASVVAASAQRKGMAWSSALATKMVLRFKPTLIAMTGICAGVEGKTCLGDVIVADPTWDWGSGKHSENEDGSPVFRLSPVQRGLSSELSGICYEICRSDEFKQRVKSNWKFKTPEGQFSAHVGPMASGASVIANDSTAQLIVAQNRDLIAIEMEAFAVMAASEYAITPSPKSIAIKSVCDFADRKKGDDWQEYAAYTSAEFANELFLQMIDRLPEQQ
jgi:nucleoside phosphorylase